MKVTRWAERLPAAVKSKADLVYERLHAAIADGELTPGERINMDELARNFGVSKIPVREAVKRLESEGLLVARVHSGVTVAEVDMDEMRGVFLAREVLEGLVARLAAQNANDTLLGELESLQEAMSAALATGTFEALPELSTRFHRELAVATGYRILAELTEQLLLAVRRYRVVAPMEESGWRSVLREHDLIVEAVRSGDADAAAMAAQAHTATLSDREADAA